MPKLSQGRPLPAAYELMSNLDTDDQRHSDMLHRYWLDSSGMHAISPLCDVTCHIIHCLARQPVLSDNDVDHEFEIGLRHLQDVYSPACDHGMHTDSQLTLPTPSLLYASLDVTVSVDTVLAGCGPSLSHQPSKLSSLTRL